MGAEYSYYLGMRDRKSGVIYPFGPYNKDGALLSIFSVGRSGASPKFNKIFISIKREEISNELNEAMDFFGDERLNDFSDFELDTSLKWADYFSVESLNTANGFVNGYVNSKELNDYLREFSNDSDYYFDEEEFDIVDGHIYASLPEEERKEYVYYMWKNWRRPECIAHEIVSIYEQFAYQLRSYSREEKNDLHPVVIVFYSY